jgi:hypothetical protein
MRHPLSPFLLVPALVVAAFGFSPVANATAQRTFVASYGLTANTAFNCSIAKPCRAFSEAIGVTNPNGEVIVLDSAGYGPVTIIKSVSLIAPPGIYAGISVVSGDGVTINAPGATVVLRGLSINGQGGSFGVSVAQVSRVRIESCVIANMTSNGILDTAAGDMIVVDTIVRDNGGAGIGVSASGASVTVDHVRSEHNGFDGFYLDGGYGSISESVFARNGGSGVWLVNGSTSPIDLNVGHSVAFDNGYAGMRVTGDMAILFLNYNVMYDNLYDILQESLGEVFSTLTNAANQVSGTIVTRTLH